MRRALLIFALAGAIAGCGGHDNLGIGAETTLVVQIKQGWTKTFETIGFYTPSGGSATIARGTYTEQCSNRTGTQVTMVKTWSLTINGGQVTTTTTDVLDQAVDGSITLVSRQIDANPNLVVQTTTFTSPGTWGATTTASGNTTFTDTSTATDSITVSGSTAIHTPVGGFTAWTTAYQHSTNGTTDVDVIEYYVPGIAGFAYLSGTTTLPGGSFDGTLSLEETNVPLP